MVSSILAKLLKRTGIHGTEQTTETSRIEAAIWLVVLILLVIFLFYQTWGLTSSFISGETTFSNEYVNAFTWDDFSQHLRISYCAPNWFDEEAILLDNISALAMIIATNPYGKIHNDSFWMLYDLLTPEEVEMVTIDTYFENRGWWVDININMTIEESKKFMENEMKKGQVSSPLELLKEYSIYTIYPPPKLVFRFGFVCQVMGKQKPNLISRIHESEIFHETNSKISKNKHNMETAFFRNPYFKLFIEPIEVDENILHPLSYLFSFESNLYAEEDELYDWDEVHFQYYVSLSVRKLYYMQNKKNNCINRKHAVFQKGKLFTCCKISCRFNYNLDYSEIDDIGTFLNETYYPKQVRFSNSLANNRTFTNKTEFEYHQECQHNCSHIRRSCYDVDVSITKIDKEVIEKKMTNNTTWVRNRSFDMKLFSFWISRERKIITFDSYVGNVGGSMGVCMGASLVSVFQLLKNVLMCIPWKKAADGDNENAPNKASNMC